jgi:hypothetical protein
MLVLMIGAGREIIQAQTDDSNINAANNALQKLDQFETLVLIDRAHLHILLNNPFQANDDLKKCVFQTDSKWMYLREIICVMCGYQKSTNETTKEAEAVRLAEWYQNFNQNANEHKIVTELFKKIEFETLQKTI